MNVTREVIYDLLPGYFSGDICPDTRALVEEFLRNDPEFSKMMERVRAAYGDRPVSGHSATGAKETFERARGFMQKQSELRGFVLACGLAVFFLIMMFLIRVSGAHNVFPLFLAIGLMGAAAAAAVRYFKLTDDGPPRRMRS
jgi:hypothetical protein